MVFMYSLTLSPCRVKFMLSMFNHLPPYLTINSTAWSRVFKTQQVYLIFSRVLSFIEWAP